MVRAANRKPDGTAIGLSCLLCLPLLMLALQAYGQNYPAKPVRLILPYPPGGGTDLVARPLAQKLGDSLGQQVIVDNRGGANGTIGMELAAKSPPDGYTIVLALTAQLVLNPAFYPRLPYDPVRDYTPITLLGTTPYLLTVHPALPVKSVKDLIALAKSKPGQLAYSSSGNGGIPHLAGKMLDRMAGTEMVHVPYRGGGPALLDLMAGQVQLNFAVIPAAMPHVKAGKLRAVAVTTAKRSQAVPGLATIGETLSGYEVTTWFGVFAPARTPAAVTGRLNREIVSMLGTPDMKDRFPDGFESTGSSPEELARYLRSELARWGKLIRENGITASD